ncbi:hypothetical protein [Bacillus sp. B15-48]|uniref:hypothetical protein n=1 Tax=Bacillus sp. B15-48 TaxID=1548601 RepID=UPI00193FEF4C|nr:hypothetical protein [Bacillus sp. B15-48]MBM4764323.1 hypothetical protein [Bacillus sp. B15-48]
MQNENYLDFYDKTLIPTSAQSLPGFFEKTHDLPAPAYWLIALEGRSGTKSSVYVWRVSIFAVDNEGCYDANLAYYSTEYFDNIDEALEKCRQLENEMENTPPIPA